MQIEKQVISLQTAKQLKELGVKRESLFYWCVPKWDETGTNGVIRDASQAKLYGTDFTPTTYPAYSVAELGEMLPMWISHNDLYWYPEILPTYSEGGTSNDERYFRVCYYSYPSSKKEMCLVNEDDLAEALAKLLIKLLENNLITPDQINAEGK